MDLAQPYAPFEEEENHLEEGEPSEAISSDLGARPGLAPHAALLRTRPRPGAQVSTVSDAGKGDDSIAKTADKVIEVAIYVFFIVSGLYVCLSGFKTFRLTMVVLGYYVSYYAILFPLIEAKWFEGDNLGHQIGLFFLSLTLGFIVSVLCYVLDKVNFLIFGAAVSCMLGLFLAEFLLDIRVPDDWVLFLVVLGAAVVVCATVAFFVLDHFIIWGFAFVGAVITPISAGIVLGLVKPFENRTYNEKLPTEKTMPFMFAILALWVAGMACQYWLRKRLIRKWQDDGEDVNPRSTFLNDPY